MRHVSIIIAACAACVSAGCLSFNPDCPVDETAIVGWTDVRLDLRREFVRTGETPIGNLVADAFYEKLKPVLPAGADFALINAGSIRDRSDCSAAEFIDRGPIRLGQLGDMLPFNNRVLLVEITERDLWLLLEHSVALLGDPGEAGLAGQFLQVSRIKFSVNCGYAAAVGNQVGQRITAIDLIDSNGAIKTLDSQNRSTSQTYRVATNSFLAGGGDGYDWLRTTVPITEEQPDFVTVADYLGGRPNRTVRPTVDGRINLDPTCTPQNP